MSQVHDHQLFGDDVPVTYLNNLSELKVLNFIINITMGKSLKKYDI